MLDDYRTHEAERSALGIPPLPLNPDQVGEVVDALLADRSTEDDLVGLLAERVPPGVAEATRIKADFLGEVASAATDCPVIDRAAAVRMLGAMRGGYSVPWLVRLLDDPVVGPAAAAELGRSVLVFDAFPGVADAARRGHPAASSALNAWAESEWLTRRPPVPDALHLTVFKVEGETNTDDLSPATYAWSRADIPLHALSLLENLMGPGAAPEAIRRLAGEGRPVAFVGDVVGTGSSRKSSVNSLLWHTGADIPGVPNKRSGGVVIAGRMAPIFRDTLRDSGALAIECDPGRIAELSTGDHIVVRAARGRIEAPDGRLLAGFPILDPDDLDAYRAGGRIPLIIGRRLAGQAAAVLGRRAADDAELDRGPFTLAQKIVGRACGKPGVKPGTYGEPVVSTVGSQDTTGPMNRNELEDLACLRFGADLVLQTFCHTAAYPKRTDVETQRTLPAFMAERGSVVLRPGDGIIHSWLNKMLLPDQLGTGSDSHTRFPLGISFPAGSGLVAFAAALGVMPLTMPESVLVRFVGRRRPGITLRDLVNAIPFVARQQGLLTLTGAKRNPFSGRVIEICGLEDLTVEEAFELTDATAERSAAACTVNLSVESVSAHLRDSVETLEHLIADGYEGAAALGRRLDAMRGWLDHPELLRADPGAPYAEVIEIDVDAITEPLLACPNDPDDVRPLSEVAGAPVDEVFIGSCMTNLGHFQSTGRLLADGAGPVPTRMWIAPPTSLVRDALLADGSYSRFGAAGARTETPGCSLCMGNQARVADGATVVSTSTRNFPNRMGRDANVYLASAEVATMAAQDGRLPSVADYFARAGTV
ncbi:MAG TPA: bifunctional aconitate hydratase 2/2-methylisocitrate dehydratase [Acidimicrobiales bacterium]|jgi:aconitate hydratase 2/2-methylisocitrate dehydratase|nr:bifunctional aconitate hydratase 2/2-methylisocitrate dehydratase [Acidimicrobiales bacterium]